MAGIDLIQICQALISTSVSLDTLPTKGKSSNNNDDNNDSNINKSNSIINDNNKIYSNNDSSNNSDNSGLIYNVENATGMFPSKILLQ